MQVWRWEPLLTSTGKVPLGGCPTSLSIFEIHTEANVMAYQDEQGVPWELPSSLEVVLVNDINP